MIFNMIAQGGGGGGGEISFEPYLDGKNHYTFLILSADDSTVQIFTGNDRTIDWGDGTAENVQAGKHLHTYNDTGLFDVTFDGVAYSIGNTAQIDYGYRGKLIYAEILEPTGTGALRCAYGLYKAYIVNSSVTYMNDICRDDYGLVECVIASGITAIGTYSFQNCYCLSKISLPTTIRTIGAQAFEYCRSLRSITLPSTVTSIGNYAFRYCVSLTEVHVKPTTPPTAGTSIFQSNFSGTIYVPSASLSAYQSASGWSTYASRMVGE